MQLAIEVSLYPLDQNYIPHIKGFIERINTYPDLLVNTSHTSTLISGEYDYLMQTVQTEMKATYEQLGQAIFVCKFLNATNMNLSAEANA
jgi:uncharacterized protein YqgV (UPF0045/DUF77 family)